MKNDTKFEKYFRHLSFIVKMEGRKSLKKYPDISKTMFEALQLIYFNKTMKSKDVASVLDISRPAVSEILSKLENQEYICKKKNMKDQREMFYSLTEKGKSVIIKVIKARTDFVNQLFAEDELVLITPIFEKAQMRLKEIDKK